MKRFRRHFLLATVVLTLLAVPVRCLTAAEKPAVLISVASVDRVLANIDYLTGKAEAGQFGVLARFMAMPYMEGVNTQQPVGVLMDITGQPSGIAFVPVVDFEKVLAKIEEIAAAPEDVGGGVMELELDQRSIFFKQQNGWVFISPEAANLNDLPQNPGQLLEGLDQQYEIAVRVNVPSIPAPLRQMAITEMKKGFEQIAAGESDPQQRELQEQLGGQGLEGMVQFIEEADQVTIGFGVDQDAGTAHLDFSVTALEGTKLAAQMSELANAESDFTGFLLPGAAANIHFSSPVSEEDKAQTLMMLKVAREKALEEIANDDDLPNDQARETAKQVANSLLDVLEQTIESGKLAGGAALVLDGTALGFVAGGYLADGMAVERSLREIADLAKSSEDAPQVTFNAGKHGDVDLHTVVLPIPEDEEEARKVLGDELVVVVGTGPKSAYVAFGEDGMGLIKNVMDRSSGNRSGPPMLMRVALGPILRFAANFEDDPKVAMLAELLENAEGKDHISIQAKAIERGMSYRVGIEEGVLQLIGKAASMQNR